MFTIFNVINYLIVKSNVIHMTLKNKFSIRRGLRKVKESHGIIVTKCHGKSGNSCRKKVLGP